MLTPAHVLSYIIEYEWTSAALCLGSTIYFLSWFRLPVPGLPTDAGGLWFNESCGILPILYWSVHSSKLGFFAKQKIKED